MTDQPDDSKKGEEFRIQSYTQKQLAEAYKTPERTFRRWLQPLRAQIGDRIGHYYNPKQVKSIVDHLGIPFVWFASILMKSFFGIEIEQQDDGGQDDANKKTGKG